MGNDVIDPGELVAACRAHLPSVVRWAGAVAKRLRGFDIAIGGKQSGSAMTDALTLADLTCQELVVSALRDEHSVFRRCRIEAEESTGDLERFPERSEWTIAIDPIDGTQQYRDRTGNGYAVMVHVRSETRFAYSLVLAPESGPTGTWVEATTDRVVCGPDDASRPAAEVLAALPPIGLARKTTSDRIYVIGFQQRDEEVAAQLPALGLRGFTAATMPGSLYELLARGEFAGSLVHSPNVYDFPVGAHLARLFGGESRFVRTREPLHFRETWMDERAHMLRLPGIAACSTDPAILDRLCGLARDWNPNRYADQ